MEQIGGSPDVTAVSGRVVIGASVAPFTSGVVHVRLEDVSFADKRASLVGEAVIRGITHDPRRSAGSTVVAFRVTPDRAIEDDHDYSVRVWLDCDGDGKPSSHDVWSGQACPVLTRGFGSDVTVTVGG
jgi:hypothetical protein